MMTNPKPLSLNPHTTPIEVVLFDLGGVLIELGGMGELAVFSNESDEDEIWRRWLSCPWVRRYERGQCESQAFAAGMVETWSMPVAPEVFLAAFASWPKGLLPGAKELVRSTRARTRVAALSNTNALHTERFHDEFRFHEDFDSLYLSHEMGLVKPDRAAFDYAISKLGCPPERILFLDDNQINVDGARAAGLRAERSVGVKAARDVLVKNGVL